MSPGIASIASEPRTPPGQEDTGAATGTGLVPHASMDGGTVNNLTELSLRNAREHRDDMARWLALEVLMTDEMALEDTTLQEHLILLQDKAEAKVRAAA
jgi:hypothetical protein